MIRTASVLVSMVLPLSLLGPSRADTEKSDECGFASVYSTVSEATASGEDARAENLTAAHRT
jgi:rare lipoprotein A (peptidoglycan hydrolase)